MVVVAKEPSSHAKLGAEFLGTFLLVLTVGCNVLGGNSIWAGVSIACVLMVTIYALGGISGANFNPSVSFALGVCRALGGPGLDWRAVGTYSAVQCAGGIAASLVYSAIFKSAFALGPASGFSMRHAVVVELIYTCMLCFVVLNVAAARKNLHENNQYYGLAIGFVIIAGAYGAGAISGGCFNPAVALGIDVAAATTIKSSFGNCVTYAASELVAAALAAVLFKIVRPEDFEKPKSMWTELASEFLGTFMLVLTVGLNVLGNSPAGAFSIAASLTCMIYALGDVSGAHFNPAVTIAIVLSGRCPDLSKNKAGKFIGAQLVGGLLAAMTYSAIYNGKTFALGPVGRNGWAQVAVAEIVFTFLLCFVVLAVAVSRHTKCSHMFGLAIGSCVTVGGLAIGGISGGSLNPAVSVGLAASQMMNGGTFWKAVVYSALEIAGGVAAAQTFKITHHLDTAPPLSKK
eukprot:TRINITY_DN52579_c0_g1_i1.p1 TRINITY_DN52579_c0_g1~~TRINITY_DN52579_c0_g1_i1.p1  ORF type:complete len:459 (-),score=86.96 TRINITY_DN52579_c0_g1_i1:68-1444(-)